MKVFTFTVQDENGMHARPAGRLTTFAKQFSSHILVCANGKEADAKRLLALIGLGATRGTELRIVIEGEDEELAFSQLCDFCRTTFGGDVSK